MKRAITIILSIVLVINLFVGCEGLTANNKATGTKSPDLTASNNAFAFNIFNQLNQEDGEKDLFISPLSISSALTMTLNGARNTTLEDMKQTLNYSDISNDEINSGFNYVLNHLQNIDKKVDINIANSIWVKTGLDVNKDFIELNKESFNAYVESLDFSDDQSVDKINKWIEKATAGMIPKMLNNIPANVVMYLINAIYFKGEWRDEFDPDLTYQKSFNGINDQVTTVDMMSRTGTIDYWGNDDYKVVRLPYGDDKVAMYCILPHEDGDINAVISGFNIEKWNDIKEKMSAEDDVILGVPKFKIEYGIKELNDSLTSLGMASAFSDRADFTGIADSIYISRVLHKAVIEVDEKGTKAAAVTVVEMKELASIDGEEPIRFIADRPFMFIIADEEDGNILFMGKKVK